MKGAAGIGSGGPGLSRSARGVNRGDRGQVPLVCAL
jgi:hypothetical protein